MKKLLQRVVIVLARLVGLNTFAHARRHMASCFRDKRPGSLYGSYEDNLCCLLTDWKPPDGKGDWLWLGSADRRRLAQAIMKVIFDP